MTLGPAPRLSVIIPVLDESGTLPDLLTDLAAQRGCDCEVLIIDGGSSDGTRGVAESGLAALGLRGQVLTTGRGRGRQMNCGARQARGGWLLFLHADSRLPDQTVLAEAIELLERQVPANDRILAGHLTLGFDLAEEERTFAYRFFEAKARTGRPWTIHGDQGFFIRPADFRRAGGFREDLPVMEDCCFAEVVRSLGDWRLLPGRILTSPRRFQVEGLAQRQTLNALLMNFQAIGWSDFLVAAPHVYRRQAGTAQLDLLPFFRLIAELLAALPLPRRWALWTATGAYVHSQAWQVGFYLDCRRHARQGLSVGSGETRWLAWFERWLGPLTDHRPGHLLTAALVRLWFSWTWRRLRATAGGEESLCAQ